MTDGDQNKSRLERPAQDGGRRSLNFERGAHAAFQIARLRAALSPMKLHWFPTLGSTNDHAIKMRRAGRLLAPAVILTGRQTAGHGRGENVWHAPRGVVTLSFVISAHDTLPPQHVPLIAGLAVRDAIEASGISGVGIKWPNDLWHDDHKVAGFLCQRFDGVDVIGVGLNANVNPQTLPREIASSSTSLHQIAGCSVDATSLVVLVAHALQRALADPRTSLAGVREAWKRHDVLAGREISVKRYGEPDVVGLAAGLDSAGRLLICAWGHTTAVLNGTVRLIR